MTTRTNLLAALLVLGCREAQQPGGGGGAGGGNGAGSSTSNADGGAGAAAPGGASNGGSGGTPSTPTPPPECPTPHPEVVQDCSDGLCRIPAGCFVMGMAEDAPFYGPSARQTAVTLTHGFVISETEVTWQQWEAQGLAMPELTGPYVTPCSEDSCPVVNITVHEAMAYANLLSAAAEPPLPACYLMEGCAGDVGTGMECAQVTSATQSVYDCEGFRLPTRVELEYAARAGTTTEMPAGDLSERPNGVDEFDCWADSGLESIAWYCANSDDATHPVGQKIANGWGLRDVLGNASEFAGSTANDWNPGGHVTDWGGDLSMNDRYDFVMCGANAQNPSCHVASFGRAGAGSRATSFSFRVVRSMDVPD